MWLGQSCKNQSCDDGKLEENNSRKQNLSCLRNFCNSTLSKNYWFPILTSDVNQQSVSFLRAWNKKKIMFWAQQSHINFNVHKHGQALAIIARENSAILPCHPWFPRKMMSEKQHRNSILMTRHYSDPGSASDWLKQISHAAQPIRSTTQIWEKCVISMEFLRSFLRRHEMLAVFSGYDHKKSNLHASCCPHGFINKI